MHDLVHLQAWTFDDNVHQKHAANIYAYNIAFFFFFYNSILYNFNELSLESSKEHLYTGMERFLSELYDNVHQEGSVQQVCMSVKP